MKKTSKLLALTLALLMLLCLCGCGESGSGRLSVLRLAPETFETRITRAGEQMKTVKSYRMDMEMEMGLEMALMNQSLEIKILSDSRIDVEQDPLRMAVETHMDAEYMGSRESRTTYAYLLQEGEEYVTYSSDDGKTWQKQTSVSLKELQQQDAQLQIQMFLSCKDSFQEGEKQTINGVETVVYTGQLTGDDIRKAVEASGSLESLGDLLGSDVTDALFADLQPIPVTVAFDEESGMVVYYEMDMTDAMGTLMQRLMNQIIQDQGGADLGIQLEMNVSAVKARVSLSDFDQISVTLPEEVKAA